jgi:hypothetical protein
LDSIQTKLAKLKNAWDEFTMGIMDSDLVKTGVDLLTKFLEVVNKSTDGLDGLAGSFIKIVSTLIAFKIGSKAFEKFKEPIMDLFKWILE